MKIFIWALKVRGILEGLRLRLKKIRWNNQGKYVVLKACHYLTSTYFFSLSILLCSTLQPLFTTEARLHSHASVIPFKIFSASWNIHFFLFSSASWNFINPLLSSSNVIASTKSSWPCSPERINQALLCFNSTLLFLYYR